MAKRSDDELRERCARASAASPRWRTTATRSSCRPTHAPEPFASRAGPRRRADRLAQSRCARRSKTTSCSRSARRRPGRQGSEPCAPSRSWPERCSRNRCATACPTRWSRSPSLLIAASYLISQLTAGQDLKIIKDLGLAAISWFGLLIAIFIGIGLVSKEVERRSVYALLSKPVTPRAVHPRQVRRPGHDAGRQPVGDDAGVLRGARSTWTSVTAPGVKTGWAAPALDPRLLGWP